MKKNRLLLLFVSLLFVGCGSQDMTIIDQNGKSIDVAIAGKDTYTFHIPSHKKKIVSEWENPFIDVHKSDWFYSVVRYCHENNLMSGTTENTFSPNASTSRAMIVSILWRLEGSPHIGTHSFSDVDESQYYADAVAWANTEGIVSGLDEAHFAPDLSITREQLVSILYRYAAYHNWDRNSDSALYDFADADTASAYAADALSWAISHQIINGIDDRLLTPKGDATRAQVAAILMNLCEDFTG